MHNLWIINALGTMKNRTDRHFVLLRARSFSDGLKYEGNQLFQWHHQMYHLQVEKLFFVLID